MHTALISNKTEREFFNRLTLNFILIYTGDFYLNLLLLFIYPDCREIIFVPTCGKQKIIGAGDIVNDCVLESLSHFLKITLNC